MPTTKNLPPINRSLIQININKEVSPTRIKPAEELLPMRKKKIRTRPPKSRRLEQALLLKPEQFFMAVDPTAYELDLQKSRTMPSNGSYMCQERSNLSSPEFWHKIVIVGGSKYYKDYVLKLIIGAAHPHDLIPVKYMKHDSDTSFFVRECSSAIEKLCKSELKIENPHGEAIQLRVILCARTYADVPINIQGTISRTLTKRFNPVTKTLNLNDFHNDPDFKDLIFCPLSQPRILYFALNQVNSRTIAFANLSLANNELVSLKSLEGVPCLKSVKCVNLSRNKIAETAELCVFNTTPVTELILDNNPCCQKFEDEISYIQKVKVAAPNIALLDGVALRSERLPRPRRNFLAFPEAGPLADQFVEHYFLLFDGKNRRKLCGIYHYNALFSMTCTYIPGQSTSANAKLHSYMAVSRNLLKLSDYTKTHHLLHYGEEAILNMLCKLPTTEHDPLTFAVSVPIYTGFFAVIHVNGVFREPVNLVRGFSRVFHLVCLGANEWQITNEMWHVYNGRSEDEIRSFKVPRPSRQLKPKTITFGEKIELTRVMTSATDLRPEWAFKCLDDLNWDLPATLHSFTVTYKLGQVPHCAFLGGFAQ